MSQQRLSRQVAQSTPIFSIINSVFLFFIFLNICDWFNSLYYIFCFQQAGGALRKLKQSASLTPLINPFAHSLVNHTLLRHKDRDIKLLVATCFSEIIRILAPNPDFTDQVFRVNISKYLYSSNTCNSLRTLIVESLLQDIFRLFLAMFAELADTASPYFSSRVDVLETVAKLEFCVLMLDTRSEDLILEMFNVFFEVVR